MRAVIVCIVAALLLMVTPPARAGAPKRVALVIGNSAYQHAGTLTNPKNDATDVAATLKKLGFAVIDAFDLNKARQLLKESGVKTPITLKLLFRSNDAVHQPTAVTLRAMWAKIGVNLELEPLDRATATKRYRANEFQVYITGWTNDIPDPSQLAAYELGFTESESYHSGYQSKAMDALLAKGQREVNVEKRRQIYYQVQDLALKDSPLIWLYYAPYTITINKKMKGFVQMATGPWIFKNVTVSE